jgi:hypothetical protein
LFACEQRAHPEILHPLFAIKPEGHWQIPFIMAYVCGQTHLLLLVRLNVLMQLEHFPGGLQAAQ